MTTKQRLNMHEDLADHRLDASGPLRRNGSLAYKCVWKQHTEAGGWMIREQEWFDDIGDAMRWFAATFEEAVEYLAERESIVAEYAARQAEADTGET